MMSTQHHQPQVELVNITPNIWRFSGQLFYEETVGSYVIQDDSEIVIIDSPNWSNHTARLLQSFGLPMRIFLTHGPSSADGEFWQKELNIKVHLNRLDLGNEWLRGTPDVVFDGDFSITSHVRAIHLPNHSPGHTVYYDDRHGGSLFSGDGILFHRAKIKHEVTPEAMHKIKELKFERLLPFHYEPILNGADKVVFSPT